MPEWFDCPRLICYTNPTFTQYNVQSTSQVRRPPESLQFAANGDSDLRDNYKLYSKVYRFYKKDGVAFTGDTNIDYDLIINYLYEDLYQ